MNVLVQQRLSDECCKFPYTKQCCSLLHSKRLQNAQYQGTTLNIRLLLGCGVMQSGTSSVTFCVKPMLDQYEPFNKPVYGVDVNVVCYCTSRISGNPWP